MTYVTSFEIKNILRESTFKEGNTCSKFTIPFYDNSLLNSPSISGLLKILGEKG